MNTRTRLLLIFEAAAFLAASLVHAGWLIPGYEHTQARAAQATIAGVLVAALIVTWLRPAGTRAAALSAQVFALLGTMIGVFTMIAGVGPQTAPDVAFHVGMLAFLAWGLSTTFAPPSPSPSPSPRSRIAELTET